MVVWDSATREGAAPDWALVTCYRDMGFFRIVGCGTGSVALRFVFVRVFISCAITDADDDLVGKLLALYSDSTLGELVLVLDLQGVPEYSRCLGHSCTFQQPSYAKKGEPLLF